MKIDGSLARKIDFDMANFALHANLKENDIVGKHRFFGKRHRRKTSIFQIQRIKSGGSFARNARFELSMWLGLMLWLCGDVPVPIKKVVKFVFLVRFTRYGNLVLHGRQGIS